MAHMGPRLLVLMLSCLLCAMGIPEQAMAQPILAVGVLGSDVGSLDPHVSTASQDKIVTAWIFNGLVRFKPGSADPKLMEPDLAERWETSSDGLTWKFYLRQGVKFHSGYGEFTSADAVFSLKRAADKSFSTAYSAYGALAEVNAIDKYIVEVKLKTPVPSFLGLVTNFHGGMIVSKKAAEELGDNFKTKPIGTGPFALKEYTPKSNVTLTANKEYFRGAPKIETILYRFVPEEASRELAFTKGELQLIYGTRDQRWVERMRRDKESIVDIMGLGEQRTLHLNTSIKPLDDPRVRKAIAHAINRDEVVAFMGKDVSRASYSVVPEGYLGFTTDVPKFEYSPDKAKALLKEAGHPNGFTLKVMVTKVDPLRLPMEIIQEQLRKVDIKVDIEILEHASWHKIIRQNSSAMVLYGAARFPVAGGYLNEFYHSASIVGKPTAVANFSHCTAADAELDQANKEADPKKQLELWGKAQQKIMADVYAIPVFELMQVWARKKTLDYGHPEVDSISNGPMLNEETRLTGK